MTPVTLESGVSTMEIYHMSTPFSPQIEIDLADAVAPGNTWHTNKEMPGDMVTTISDVS